MMTITTPDRYGAGLPSCSADHADELSIHLTITEPDSPQETRQVSPTSCAHCAWCGTLVAVVEHCPIHADACPSRDVTARIHYTHAAAELAARGQRIPWDLLAALATTALFENPDELVEFLSLRVG
jgi:hypothetical protein